MIALDDFEKIVLSSEELKTLKSLTHGRFGFQNRYNSILLKYSLVKVASTPEKESQIITVSISDKGKRYLLFLSRKKRDKMVPLIMSGTAIMISLIALLSQLGILRLQ